MAIVIVNRITDQKIYFNSSKKLLVLVNTIMLAQDGQKMIRFRSVKVVEHIFRQSDSIAKIELQALKLTTPTVVGNNK